MFTGQQASVNQHMTGSTLQNIPNHFVILISFCLIIKDNWRNVVHEDPEELVIYANFNLHDQCTWKQQLYELWQKLRGLGEVLNDWKRSLVTLSFGWWLVIRLKCQRNKPWTSLNSRGGDSAKCGEKWHL